jgi:putative nucleotidyltransferase with HDIG domain
VVFRGVSSATRSLTLLRVFLLASGAILLAGGVVLGRVLTDSVRHQILLDRQEALTQYVDGILGPALVRGDHVVVGKRATSMLKSLVEREPELVTVKVWRKDGVLAWTNRAQSRIGRRFEIDDELADALVNGEASGTIGHLDSTEAQVERNLGFDHMLEIYAPLRTADGGSIAGAYEIYANPSAAEAYIATRKHTVWGVVAVVFLALYLALAVLVRGASGLMRRQQRQLRERAQALMESYRRLEERSLEAVEALNAIVDAKDPYTAGHSQRVQRIALAIAGELELDGERLDALTFGSLFHDIGKLRVPDAVLTKPARLTDGEFALIKRHPADGAEIVGHLSRLRGSVAIIRHHHERWDGAGYPDGLAGDEIPLEAAVAGLADAWDAMTTDRPYRRALAEHEALAQVRDGRGTQFHPAVVDAFFRAFRRRPSAFTADEPLDEPATALAG